MFGMFSALILRNPEFSLTYNDWDTLLCTLGTLIEKLLKLSGPNWNFEVMKPFLFSGSDVLQTLDLNVLSINSTKAAKNDPMPPALWISVGSWM